MNRIYSLITLLIFSIGYCASASASNDPIINTQEIVAWTSILPPLIAVILAFITRKLLVSLLAAILTGTFLHASNLYDDNLIRLTLINGSHYLIDNITNAWNLKVLGFVVVILSMISVIIVSGGLKAIVARLTPYAKTSRSAQLITAFCGLIIFIDDYANTMIVGSSMRPVTDQYRVSREKLAFIIDATSAPVAGLAIISTWIGFEVGLFGEISNTLNLGKDGYNMFFDAFAYRFYCILMLLFVFITIITRWEFGPMKIAEQRAITTGKLIADDATPPSQTSFTLIAPDINSKLSLKTALIPFSVLFMVLIAGLWIDGGGYSRMIIDEGSFFQLQSWRETIAATKNSTNILLISAIFALITAIYFARKVAGTSPTLLFKAIKTGVHSSLLPILILLLAWSLKSVCDDLNTGKFIVESLSPHLTPMAFPVLLFIIAAVTAFGTGTSWGTMSILIPIAIPIAFTLDQQQYGLITIISLGAVLDGAIFGDHCSPISDTTIMSSIASQCDHIHHVQTQIPYSLLVAAVAMLFGYLPAAAGLPSSISYLTGFIALIICLYFLNRRHRASAHV